jgi:nitrile hydratase beta subunit
MNGAHDMGGMHGFGPVQPESDEPVFHGEWEKRAFALTLAMAMPGQWNIDMSRFARENRDPAEYLSMSYYQIWFAALETMLKERDLISDDEIVVGHALGPAKSVERVLSPSDVLRVLHRGRPTERETNTQTAFKAGDRVRARNINPRTHTRLPRISRQQRHRRQREPAMALHRAL